MKRVRAIHAVGCIIAGLAPSASSFAKAKNDLLCKAVQQAIPLIEKSAAVYVEKRDCFSCHHQALTVMALSRAKLSGYKVHPDGFSTQTQFTLEYFHDRGKRLMKGEGVPGGPYSAGYALTGLSAAGEPGGDTIKTLVKYLLKTQHKDGSWRIRTHRPPLEDSHLTATALAIRGIVGFADAADRNESMGRALAWLKKAEPKSTEDHVFKLLGLHWGNGDAAKASTAKALMEMQRDDHGWGQMPNMKSDAYATGQVLFALREVGFLKADSPDYRLCSKWLIDHQDADGSWHVKTHSKPIQKYFESGFPHGKDQFISISATCWALLALLD